MPVPQVSLQDAVKEKIIKANILASKEAKMKSMTEDKALEAQQRAQRMIEQAKAKKQTVTTQEEDSSSDEETEPFFLKGKEFFKTKKKGYVFEKNKKGGIGSYAGRYKKELNAIDTSEPSPYEDTDEE